MEKHRVSRKGKGGVCFTSLGGHVFLQECFLNHLFSILLGTLGALEMQAAG